MDRGVIVVRLSKIVMTGGLAFWAFLVTLGNVTDYDSNWRFVQHVLAMDTVFPDSTLTWRAITSPAVQTLAYWAIIATEGLTSLAFLAAAVLMARKLTAGTAAFQRAKSATAIGVALAFALWFIGFMAIGGEWFAMWQSGTWNGQDAAFTFYMTVLAVAVYVFLDTDGAPSTSD
jgi:predicted small integral membrane protein